MEPVGEAAVSADLGDRLGKLSGPKAMNPLGFAPSWDPLAPNRGGALTIIVADFLYKDEESVTRRMPPASRTP